MARARRASDEIYNLRRRARRAAERAERRGDFELAEKMRRDIEQTYYSRKQGDYKAGTTERFMRLERERYETSEHQRRKNQMFLQQLSAANKGEASSIGPGGEADILRTTVFFWATRRLWEGADPKRRMEIIARRYGVYDYEQLFNEVMAGQADAVRAIEATYGDTSEEGFEDRLPGEKEYHELSPVEITALVRVMM